MKPSVVVIRTHEAIGRVTSALETLATRYKLDPALIDAVRTPTTGGTIALSKTPDVEQVVRLEALADAFEAIIEAEGREAATCPDCGQPSTPTH